MGYQLSYLEKLTRWNMVAELRTNGTDGDENKKYCRGERNTSYK